MNVNFCSQDVFKSSQSQFTGPVGSPTKGALLSEWRCEEASEASFLTCSLSWGSHHLPSLGIADNLPDIVEIDQSKLCSSEFLTVEGIDNLTGLALKYYFLVKDGRVEAVTDYLHVLSVFEHVGIGGKLPEDVLAHLDNSLLRMARKADAGLTRAIHGQQAVRNPSLHASLFTWKVAFTVFASDNDVTEETKSRRERLLKFALNLAAVGLIRVYENFKSVTPCNCVQAFVFMLFRDKRRFEHTIVSGVFPLPGFPPAQELLRSQIPSPMEYFIYYVAVAEYLLKLKKISESTEWCTNFVDRMFVMATELLDSRNMPTVCETLAEFLLKHNHDNLESTRKNARILTERMIDELKKNPIQELESLARDSPDEWARQVLDEFSCVDSKQKHIIRLMTLLVKDKDIGEGLLSSYVTPFFSSMKNCPKHSICTVLSFLLYLLKSETSLFQELGSWLLSLADSPSDDSFFLKMVFSANQMAQTISQRLLVEYDFNRTRFQLLNKIRLPLSKGMFMKYILAEDPNEELKDVDLKRTATLLSNDDFRRLLEHFSLSSWLLPVEVWTKAKEMGERGDRTALDFSLNQLCLGMSLKKVFYSKQMKALMEKYEKDKSFSREMLVFLRNILDRRNLDVNVEQFVPLWITAVVVFSHSMEQETRSVSDSIWEKLSRSLGSILPCADTHLLSQAQSVDYIFRLLEILPRSPLSAQKLSAQKLSHWFPGWLCTNLKSFAQEPAGRRREMAMRVVCRLLSHHAPTLFSFAVENEAKQQSFSQSIFVSACCAITDKKDVCLDPVVRSHVVEIVSALGSIPEHRSKGFFVRARLKTILTLYADEPFIQAILEALEGKGNYLEKLKAENKQIKQLCDIYGF